MASAFGHGLWAFIKHYIFKVGFKDGWAGFVIAFGNFEGTFYRYAKRYAMLNATELRDKAKANAMLSLPDARHPVVLTHPVTGRKALYAEFTTKINEELPIWMVTLGTCSCGDTFSYAFGSTELMDAAIEAHLRAFFEQRKMNYTEAQRKQAMRPASAQAFSRIATPPSSRVTLQASSARSGCSLPFMRAGPPRCWRCGRAVRAISPPLSGDGTICPRCEQAGEWSWSGSPARPTASQSG